MSKKKAVFTTRVKVCHGVDKLVDSKTGALVAYYGFSHRAGCQFKIGDKLFDEKWTGGLSEAKLSNLPFTSRGGRTIRTWKEAQQAAKNFSNYVS